MSAPPAFREDPEVYPLALDLAGCLCQELESSGLPAPCFCGVLPGREVASDYCQGCDDGSCGGQAWVRVIGAVPSTAFPAPAAFRSTCDAPLAAQFEIGVIRCAPMPSSSGEPPGVGAQMESVRLQLADMQAMRRAILCCSKTARREHVLGDYAPTGPLGGCVGGTWTAAISVI